MQRCKLYLVAIVLIVLASSGVAIGNSMDNTVQLQVDTDGKQHVQIHAGSYYFEPDHIVAKVNVPVELSLSREWGIVPHTFVLKIPQSTVKIDVSLSTDPTIVTFTPTVIGKFEFYCKNKFLFFKSHEEKGMKGVLEVVP